MGWYNEILPPGYQGETIGTTEISSIIFAKTPKEQLEISDTLYPTVQRPPFQESLCQSGSCKTEIF